MRVMVILKANKDSEAGVLPSQRLLTEMGRFNEELVKAGIMLAGEGLQASFGSRKRGSGGRRSNSISPVTSRLRAGILRASRLPVSNSKMENGICGS